MSKDFPIEGHTPIIIKTKPCEYCHRLPLHAGGCNLMCFKGGWIGRAFLNLELLKQSMEVTGLLSKDLDKKSSKILTCRRCGGEIKIFSKGMLPCCSKCGSYNYDNTSEENDGNNK